MSFAGTHSISEYHVHYVYEFFSVVPSLGRDINNYHKHLIILSFDKVEYDFFCI